ncbi:MAG: hypothetical protein IH588_17060 [Anaerolineales bacterium]|nr:hypothetical protein [Anaerolineales bacterium]
MNKASAYSKDVTGFFLILTFVFGIAVRVIPLLRVDFPLVDGGMFYSMIKDLRAANFSLPEFTTYNNAQIPFAYPLLAFYLAGILNATTNISILKILQWLPGVVTILNIPLFYYFSKQILKSEARAALATLIFSLTPNSYWWNIVGGGLTRSLGALLFTATLVCTYQMYQHKTKAWVAAAIVSAAGSVLSHPAWALQSVVAFILLWWFFGRDKQGTIYSVIVGLGVLVLTSPWWAAVISNHGIGTLLNASTVTHSRLLFWTVFFALSFTGEYAPVIAVFGMIGFFLHLARKDYFLIAWALLCLFVDPRGGLPAAVFPFSIMAATSFADGVATRLSNTNVDSSPTEHWMEALKLNSGRLFFGFFILLFLYNAYQVSDRLSHQVLSAEERKAIEWAKANTELDERFLILDEEGNPLLSPLTEWFPALAERRSVATIQGTEWLPGEENYNELYGAVTDIHQCLYQDVNCLLKLQDELPDDYEYILLSGKQQNASGHPLLASLKETPSFTLVYASPTISIFKVP